MSNNPYQPGQPQQYPQHHQGGDASGKVAAPAIALMVVGGLNVLLSLWGLAQSVMNMMGGGANAQKEAAIEQWRQAGMSPEQIEQFSGLLDIASGPMGIALNGLALIVGCVVLLGAIKMKNLNSRGLAFTGAILAMIPCLSQCCILGLPFGIWAIVVLNNPDVKRSFS